MSSSTSAHTNQSLQLSVTDKPDSSNYTTVQDGPDDTSITVTCHADFRWVQRAREFCCRPCQAWSRAEPVILHSAAFECVRFDSKTETLLCVKNNVLVTVLSAEYERFTRESDSRSNNEVSYDRQKR